MTPSSVTSGWVFHSVQALETGVDEKWTHIAGGARLRMGPTIVQQRFPYLVGRVIRELYISEKV